MRWLVADSLYCEGALFCSHLDSYSYYLREAGEDVDVWRLGRDLFTWLADPPEVVFALDAYDAVPANLSFQYPMQRSKFIAQVAAVCSPMPWEVRKPDGSLAYDLVLSSIPWMVEAARTAGCRAQYMPLAFDTRARVCGMGVERDLGAIFIGTVGPNHQRRAHVLDELRDVVTVLPPVFGREYFRTLARAKVVVNVHAEWARGTANNMRLFEAQGMGAICVSDGAPPNQANWAPIPGVTPYPTNDDWRVAIRDMLASERASMFQQCVLASHTYESRIPRLIELVKSLPAK